MEHPKILQFPQKNRVSIDPRGSELSGFPGLFESMLRRFKRTLHLFTLLPLYLLACGCMGTSLVPGIFLFDYVSAWTRGSGILVHHAALGFSLAAGFFLYGFSMLFIVPLANWALGGRLKPWRGSYYSWPTVRWYIHNALTYLMRFTFLRFITPSPLGMLFYKLMGMKIGRGTQLNSTEISDPSLITLGANVTIGGSATICAHYGMSGILIIAPVTIGDGAVIGLRAVIMGGVEIGAGAKILPNSVVLPKTIVPPGETWGGVPALLLSKAKLAA